MSNKCPFFGKCGGCKFDFTAPTYHQDKLSAWSDPHATSAPIWIPAGTRRRADFAFNGGNFGFYEPHSKNILSISHCPNLTCDINAIIPHLTALPWSGTGSCLVTSCDNGIDICITSSVPYFSPQFRNAAQKVPALRITWNNQIIKQSDTPKITFGDQTIEYPSGAFLQPSIHGADIMRELVLSHTHDCTRIADLFCGLGNFTFATNADGFDIVGTGTTRNLFTHPLTVGMLNTYDCVIMDPPRAGAMAQCRELIKSNTKKIIYISCNPATFARDQDILTTGGYKLTTLIPIDQFTGSHHWELFSVFEK